MPSPSALQSVLIISYCDYEDYCYRGILGGGGLDLLLCLNFLGYSNFCFFFVFLIVSVFSYCSAEVLGAGLCQFGLFLGSFSLVNTYISCSMFWCWFLVFSTKFFNS